MEEELKSNSRNGVKESMFTSSVQNSLRNIADKEGFTSYNVSKEVISTANYLGDLYLVNISGKSKKGFREIHIFLKHAIPSEALKPILDVQTCYSQEIFFYNELSFLFDTLQENVQINEEERFKIAKCYECSPDAIFLENLARKGFKTLHRMEVMPLKFAESAIAQLAKLHGLSFVLKHKKNDYFEKKIKTLHSPLHCNDLSAWKSFVSKQFENSSIYFDRDIRKKIENFEKNSFYEKFPKYFTGVTDSVKCLCHGDFRISNVMLKENDEVISEVVVIDYQMIFYGSPVTDLIYFIYTSTDKKFRKTHMNDLKDLYHEELTKFLKHFDLDINEVYPKKVYEKDFHDTLDYGLMVALYFSPVIFTVEEHAPDFGKDNLDGVSYKMDVRHEEWIREIIEEYLARGILK